MTFSVLLSACNKDDKYQFTTSRSAVETYRAFLSKIKSVRTSNTKEYVASLKEWKEVNDTVYKFLVADSAFVKYHNEASDYFLIHDSIRKELLRLAETWRYGYDDVLSIKEQTSIYKDDSELAGAVSLATPFFASLDSTAISVCDKASILKRYRYFLTTTLSRGVNSREDMLRFIRDEDYMFRTFLHHLYEMDDEPLADISRNTEAICRNIFIAAREGRIPSKDAIVYMSMRTVRRLLQNSAECVENINRLQMKGKAQGNAYLWMTALCQHRLVPVGRHDPTGAQPVRVYHLPTAQVAAVCRYLRHQPERIELSAATAVAQNICLIHLILIIMIVKEVNKFMALMPLILPKLIDSKQCVEPDIAEDSAVLYFNLEERFPIGMVMDMIDDDLDLQLLYHGSKKSEPRILHCCFFASPKLGKSMFKINLLTGTDGFVDSVAVTVYDTVDVFAEELDSDLLSHTLSFDFTEAMTSQELLSVFCKMSYET